MAAEGDQEHPIAPFERILYRGRIDIPKLSLLELFSKWITDLGRPLIGGIPRNDLNRFGVPFPLAVGYVVLLCAIFSSLISVQVNVQKDQKFLSLTRTEDLLCQDVPISLSEKHYATFFGTWDTQSTYNSNQSLFEIRLKGATMSGSQYRDAMLVYQQGTNDLLSKYGSKMFVLNLLVLLVSLDFCNIPHLEFTTSADATYVFNGGLTANFLANREGVCIGSLDGKQYISGTYDFGSSQLEFSLPLYLDSPYLNEMSMPTSLLSDSLLAGAPCADKFGGLFVDYVSEWMTEYRDGELKFRFDVRSLMAAIGMNLGVDVTALYTRVNSGRYLNQGTALKEGFEAYIDPWYEDGGMDPFWCLDVNFARWGFTEEEKKGPPICFVTAHGMWPGDMIYYPTITQIAADYRTCDSDGKCRPMVCECNEYHLASWYCQANRVIFGLFFSTTSQDRYSWDDYSGISAGVVDATVDFGRRMQKFLLDDSENGDTNAIMHVSDVLGYSLVVSRSPATANRPINVTSQSSEHASWARGLSYNQLLEEAFDKLGCLNCSALVFEVDGSRAFNKFGAELSEIPKKSANKSQSEAILGCSNGMDFSAAFSAMINNPPVALVYPYYECQKSTKSLLVTAFGSSLAATNFIGAAAWIISGYLIAWILRWRLKSIDDPELVLTKRTKNLVASVYERVKEDSLVAHLESLAEINAVCLERIKQLECSRGLSSPGLGKEEQMELDTLQRNAKLTLDRLKNDYCGEGNDVSERISKFLHKNDPPTKSFKRPIPAKLELASADRRLNPNSISMHDVYSGAGTEASTQITISPIFQQRC